MSRLDVTIRGQKFESFFDVECFINKLTAEEKKIVAKEIFTYEGLSPFIVPTTGQEHPTNASHHLWRLLQLLQPTATEKDCALRIILDNTETLTCFLFDRYPINANLQKQHLMNLFPENKEEIENTITPIVDYIRQKYNKADTKDTERKIQHTLLNNIQKKLSPFLENVSDAPQIITGPNITNSNLGQVSQSSLLKPPRSDDHTSQYDDDETFTP